jgi:hypothetical protein
MDQLLKNILPNAFATSRVEVSVSEEGRWQGRGRRVSKTDRHGSDALTVSISLCSVLKFFNILAAIGRIRLSIEEEK